MDHIAIDLGGRESQICVRSGDGSMMEERRLATRSLRGLLAKRPPGRVVLETCAEAFAVADAALEAGHEVRVVPATLVRSLGVGSRGTKSDQRDARILSEVSCRIDLPSVHVPSKVARERKAQCGGREVLVRSRTQLINAVRGWLRGQIRSPRSGCTTTFASRVRRLWEEKSATALPRFIERQLEAIELLTDEIAEADRELEALAHQDPVCIRLMSVPGVGPVTALRFVAALDDVRRFATAHQVESYLGLVPGENSSSERQRKTGITKAGAPALRWTLVQAAWTVRRCRPSDPMVQWAAEVEKRRGKHVATLALARKLAGILYALWRDASVYDATRTARPAPTTSMQGVAKTTAATE